MNKIWALPQEPNTQMDVECLWLRCMHRFQMWYCCSLVVWIWGCYPSSELLSGSRYYFLPLKWKQCSERISHMNSFIYQSPVIFVLSLPHCDILVYNKKYIYIFGLYHCSWHRAPNTWNFLRNKSDEVKDGGSIFCVS